MLLSLAIAAARRCPEWKTGLGSHRPPPGSGPPPPGQVLAEPAAGGAAAVPLPQPPAVAKAAWLQGSFDALLSGMGGGAEGGGDTAVLAAACGVRGKNADD